jgi:hypothetical protein
MKWNGSAWACASDNVGTNTSGFTDTGTLVTLQTSTDDVTIGSAVALAKLAVDGDTDEIQLLVQANGTQTANVFVVENSAGTDLFTVNNSGNTTVAGTLGVTGATTISSTLGVTGTTTLSGNLLSNGNTTIGDATTDRLTITSQIAGGTPLVFQGATDNAFTTSLVITDPTANRTITVPDASGTVILSGHTFTGDVTGTLGAGGTTTLTVAADSVALGTETTGNYVAGNTAGTGIAVTGSAGEGWSPTVSLDYTNTLASNALTANQSTFASTGLLFEGATSDGFETLVTLTDPTADNTITIPNVSGTVITTGNLTSITTTGTITAGTWQGSVIADAYINDAITISSAGTVDWTALSNYPTACGAGTAVTTIGEL